jgi:hypothetical protein
VDKHDNDDDHANEDESVRARRTALAAAAISLERHLVPSLAHTLYLSLACAKLEKNKIMCRIKATNLTKRQICFDACDIRFVNAGRLA